jgi:PST family polysaccharide transporter
MHRDPISLALTILRNSAALMTVGMLSKAMGLVIAVLVARFLGPESMGLFALLFSIAFLVESIAPLGLQDVLIRDVAARPQERVALWKSAARLALGASLVPSLAFLAAAYVYRDHEAVCASLVTLAIGMPCAALALMGQATLQGLERVLYLTWTTFLTRVASLVVLVIMLVEGAGVESAFISRVIFQASAALFCIYAILRHRPAPDGKAHARISLSGTLPFALNRVVMELTSRAPLLLLPTLFGLKQIGFFDAADRIRLTLGIAIGVAASAIMPAFSRSFAGADANRHALVSYALKYVCLLMSVAAAAISIFAAPIVHLLYGAAFSESAVLLVVLVWAQVLVATDMMLKQAIVAGGRTYAVVTRAIAGLVCLAALVLALGKFYGLIGAAAAVFLAAAVTLSLDLRFVVREVLTIDVATFVLKPLAGAILVGSVLLLLEGASLLLQLTAGALVCAVAVWALRLLPKDEREFLKAALGHSVGKRLPAESSNP